MLKVALHFVLGQLSRKQTVMCNNIAYSIDIESVAQTIIPVGQWPTWRWWRSGLWRSCQWSRCCLTSWRHWRPPNGPSIFHDLVLLPDHLLDVGVKVDREGKENLKVNDMLKLKIVGQGEPWPSNFKETDLLNKSRKRLFYVLTWFSGGRLPWDTFQKYIALMP